MIDATILELSRSKREYAQMAQPIEGEPGRAAVRRRSSARRPARAARPARGRLARARPRLPHAARRDRRRAGRADQGPQGRARAADGGQRGRAAARRVRGGHRGRARAARRLRQGVPRDPRPPRPRGRLVRPRLGRLPARPPVRRPHARPAASRRWPPSPTRSPTLVAEFDGVNASEHGDGRVRSPFNPRVFGDDLYAAFREVKALFDPDGRLNPGVMVDAAPITVEPARPRAAARAAAAHPLRVRGRDARAPPTAASASAPAARPARA